LKEMLFTRFVKLKVLPDFVFRNSKPAIVGVKVLEGKLKAGIKVMKNGEVLGKIIAIQSKNEPVKEAAREEEVAVSIDEAVVGRNLFEGDELYAFIPKKLKKKTRKRSDLNEHSYFRPKNRKSL